MNTYTPMRTTLKELYLEWVNDFLTIERFAEHHGMSRNHAEQLIEMGKWYHHVDIPA